MFYESYTDVRVEEAAPDASAHGPSRRIGPWVADGIVRTYTAVADGDPPVPHPPNEAVRLAGKAIVWLAALALLWFVFVV